MNASRFRHRAPNVNGATKPPKPAAVNTILLIDRERQVRRFITAGLRLHRYSITEAESGTAGLSIASTIRPDLVILDPALPDMNGAEVLKTIRSWSDVPIIILSTQSEEEHKVSFLRSGADDYITKPFGIAELAARCEVMLRRSHKGADRDPVVRTGPLMIDLVSHAVTLNGLHVTLTRQEYRLLHLLASHVGSAIPHDRLIQEIWGHDLLSNVRYLRNLVRKLRQKLEVDASQPKLLMSESSIGYRLHLERVQFRHSGRRRKPPAGAGN
jgi:two-component system, OmpR family, KDP operon response regulator KdpE